MVESKQVMRTRKLIAQALLQLMQTEDFDKIKVTDICDCAMITRATFYKYYEDKFHLTRSIVEEYKERILDEALKGFVYDSPKELYLEIARIFFNFAEKHKNTILSIIKHGFNERLNMLILEMIDNYIEDIIKDQYHDKTKVPIQILSKFFTGGFTSLAIYFLTTDKKYTKEQILDYLDKMLDIGAFV
ncbi:MAG: TetR/AcrR family transcriptional regulator C-terminal domain-containing protein [Clostridia bacterium]|nr:TetR/AcrR family transcriptional regulator C-terminal domain-containing protein [Clostridia bacterium]